MKGIIRGTIREMTREEVIISIRSRHVISAGKTTEENVGEKGQQLVSDVAKQVISGTLVLI